MNIIAGSVKLFNMTDEEYFGKGLPGYISNSRMGLINPAQGGSVERYLNGFDQKTDSLQLGSAVHQLILEPELYELASVTAPSDSIRKIAVLAHKLTTREDNPLSFDDAIELGITTYNYYKGNCAYGSKRYEGLIEKVKPFYDYLCGSNSENVIVLTEDLREKCINALAAIKENPKFEELLKPSGGVEYYNEHVMTCDIKYDGEIYHLKLKIDNFTVDHVAKHVVLNDLKTTSFKLGNFMGVEALAMINGSANGFSLEPVKLHGSFQKYCYYRQMYMYGAILQEYIRQEFGEGYTFEANMLVVETVGYKPKAEVFNVSDYWLEQGRIEFDYLLDLISKVVTGEKASDLDLLDDEDYGATLEDNELVDLD